MSLPVFQATIVNDSGDIIPSAVITVLDEITGLGLTVYSNRAGTVPLGTNGVFTAGTDGFSQFFAPAGNYRVKAEQAASGFEQTWDFVPLVGTAAFVDIGAGSGQVPLNSDLPDFGTAATADVQTSPTDTTADVVARNDAFGMGDGVADAAIYTGDLLALSYTERVRVSNTATNKPVVSDGYARNIRRSSTYKTIEFISDDNITYNNTLKNGVWSGWDVVYTGANLNPNVFGGVAGFKAATGYARSATALRVDLEHSVEGVGQSIIKGAGSFNVTDTFFNVLFVVPPANITIATQNQKLMTINISGLSGLVADRPYFLTSIATNSTLEVV